MKQTINITLKNCNINEPIPSNLRLINLLSLFIKCIQINSKFIDKPKTLSDILNKPLPSKNEMIDHLISEDEEDTGNLYKSTYKDEDAVRKDYMQRCLGIYWI